ncbi:MAG: porin family protein [Bacteroidota bacterium]
MSGKTFLLPTLLLLFTFLFSTSLEAQYRSKGKKRNKHRFNAGLLVGPSLSQVDGDKYHGFNKLGIRGGLKGMMYLSDKLDLTTCLLFNQKGSVLEDLKENGSSSGDRFMHLNYMEVPIMITYKSLPKDRMGYRFDAGFSIGRLINNNIQDRPIFNEDNIDYSGLESAFVSNEFNLVGGMSFNLGHVGLGIHYTYQLNKLFDNPGYDADLPVHVTDSIVDVRKVQITHLRNYQLGIFLSYHIF